MNPKPLLNCSDALTAVILEGVKDTIGPEAFEEAVTQAGLEQLLDAHASLSAGDFSALRCALAETYGQQGAGGIVLRAGRAGFNYFVKKFAGPAGFDDPAFRLLPIRKRILTGLRGIASVFARDCGCKIEVRAGEGHWTWVAERCLECDSRSETAPACLFTVGLLQEYMAWISAGRVYPIRENACRARGDPACEIIIEQRFLD